MSLSGPSVPTQGFSEQVLFAASAAPLSASTPSKVVAKINSARSLMKYSSSVVVARSVGYYVREPPNVHHGGHNATFSAFLPRNHPRVFGSGIQQVGPAVNRPLTIGVGTVGMSTVARQVAARKGLPDLLRAQEVVDSKGMGLKGMGLKGMD